MARRRKIPGKKHRGVKDPEDQKRQRELQVKTKVNAAPKDGDVQEVPRRLQGLFQREQELLQKLKEKKEKAREKRTRLKEHPEERGLIDSTKHMGYEMRLPGMKPLRPVPVFQQKPGEPTNKFLTRVHYTVNDVLKRREYENKFNVDLVQDSKTGKTIAKKRNKDELEVEMDKAKAAKAKDSSTQLTAEEAKANKRQLRRLKEKEKRLKKKRKQWKKMQDDEGVGQNPSDKAQAPKFNEVALAPPELGRASRKPGAKDNLLLKAKLQKGLVNPKKNVGKMSLAKQQMLKDERERVIAAYRGLKKARRTDEEDKSVAT